MDGLATSPLLSEGLQRFKAGDKIRRGPQMGGLATPPLPSEGPQGFTTGDKIISAPQMGGLAASPLPSGGVPNASKRGTKSEWAHKWADCLHHPCLLGVPNAS